MLKQFKASKWNHLRLGLVLSGGGAKGAYEAGVLKALDDLCISPQVKAVSGTSIGAFNTLFFAFCGGDGVVDIWNELSYSDVMTKNDKLDMKTIRELLKRIPDDTGNQVAVSSVLQYIGTSDQSLFTLDGVSAFIQKYADFNKLRTDGRDYYACAYNISESHPDYYNLNKLSDDDIIQVVRASASIPYVFPAVEYMGVKYCDGGIAAPGSPVQNADKTPVLPLTNHDLDAVIVVYINQVRKTSYSVVDRAKIIELFPSQPLESFKGTGTMNFSKKTLKQHIALGYSDAMHSLAPMAMGYLSGENPELLIERLNKRNREFISEQEYNPYAEQE